VFPILAAGDVMKRILIVGATSAIATACARIWAREGSCLFLVARDAERLAQSAADLSTRGAVDVQTFLLDVNELDRHAGMLEAALAALRQLDIVLIAHGTLPVQEACSRDADLAIREFATNGASVLGLLTRIANILEAQRNGCLAVITSVAGDRGRPSNYLYGSAKAAVSTFCEGLRARLFPSGVHVMDIRPGFVATPMTAGLPLPSLLVVQPDTVARRIVAGIARRRDVLYAPAFWALIMLAVRSVPGFIFKRMRL
jgi:decaprenylphospho-beta-D-erythro-pentofuranosid-2-ulose 2-reductase